MGTKESNKKKVNARDGMVAAGVAVIAEKGYSEASIDDIVQQAGVSKGAFYHYFQSKEDFVVDIIKKRAEQNLARFQERYQEGEISLASWIEDSFSTIITFPAEDADWSLFSLEVMLAGMNPGREKIAGLGEWIHATWREMLVEMIRRSREFKAGEVNCDPELIAVGIMAMIDGLLIHSRIEIEAFTKENYISRLAPMLKHWIVRDGDCDE
jgi:TetR/AcrR family transcriptional repressor of nem operon